MFDRPREGPFSGCSIVIDNGERLRLHCRGLPESGRDGTDREVTCVAFSDDGLEWARPNLGLIEIYGTRDNNFVLADAAPCTHNFTPFLAARPGVDSAERFKALGGSA